MTIFARFLADRRRATTWWVVGMLVLIGFSIAFWPTVRGQPSFDELMAEMPEAMRAMFGIDEGVSIGSAPGYLQGRVFSLMLPTLLVIQAIGLGAAAIGGSEEDGTLEQLLAAPVRRGRVARDRAAAVAVLVAAPALTGGLATAVMGAPIGLLEGVSLVGLAGVTLAALALALLHGGLAFAVGAGTGRHGLAVAAASGLAVAGYLAEGVLAAAAAPTWVRNLNPWHWYLERNMLVDGVPPQSILGPLLLAVILVVLGTRRFEQRDLR